MEANYWYPLCLIIVWFPSYTTIPVIFSTNMHTTAREVTSICEEHEGFVSSKCFQIALWLLIHVNTITAGWHIAMFLKWYSARGSDVHSIAVSICSLNVTAKRLFDFYRPNENIALNKSIFNQLVITFRVHASRLSNRITCRAINCHHQRRTITGDVLRRM